MHSLVAIALVFLTGFAWMITVLTLLIALAKGRRRALDEGVEDHNTPADRRGRQG
jgi:ABC-type antimicrobial peptide transport system permease subunit